MAITTLDGVIAGMQPPVPFAKAVSGTLIAGRPHCFWGMGGSPGAGAYNATLNGATLSSSSSTPAGALRHTDPVTGNTYLARLSATATQGGMLMLCDRLWHNQLTAGNTTLQSLTTPTWPARDIAGSTNGDGVYMGIETSAAASNQAAVISVSYTNQSGASGRTSTFLDLPTAVATIAGSFFRLNLTAGDTGVRSIQSAQFSTAWTTGTINMVAYRVLTMLELPGALSPNAVDALTSGFPRLYDGVVPFFLFLPNTTTATMLTGSYVETQG